MTIPESSRKVGCEVRIYMECPKCKALQEENAKLRKLIESMANNSGFIKFLADIGLKEIDEGKNANEN
jgi:hypothetical protein